MPGTQIFTVFQLGKESTKGTPVAATRQFYPDGTGELEIDRMLSLHRGNRGTYTNLAHASTRGVGVSIPFRSDPDVGVAFDELPYIFNQISGGTAGTGAGADKTWTQNPNQSAAGSANAFTIEVGDDTQCYEVEYCQATEFTLAAARDSLTTAEVNWVGRQPTKVTKTAVSANTGVKIPGKLWEIRFATAQSGLTGASDQDNFLLDWNLRVQTGWTPRFYQDGNDYFGQMVESMPKTGELTLHVESTALAVSEFYDKWYAQTVDFAQLKATGPSLGGSNYSAQIQLALIYTSVKPIASEIDGVNIYEVTAETTYDSTWTQAMSFITVASVTSF